MKTIQISCEVRVPSDHHDWQLYDMRGADAAAKSMTDSLMAAVERFKKEGPFTSREAAVSALRKTWAWLDNELDKFSNFGASDTEPVGVAADCLSRMCSLVAFGRRNGFENERMCL